MLQSGSTLGRIGISEREHRLLDQSAVASSVWHWTSRA
jgi:hypothetical protein